MKNRPRSKEITEKVYRAAKPRAIFTSSSVLSPLGIYIISNKHKNCMVYTFQCSCSKSYIGETSRNLETRTKEHFLKYVKEHIKKSAKNN